MRTWLAKLQAPPFSHTTGSEDRCGKVTSAATLTFLDVLPDPFLDETFQSEVARAEKNLLRQDGPSLRGNGGPAFSDVGDVFRVPGEQEGL